MEEMRGVEMLKCLRDTLGGGGGRSIWAGARVSRVGGETRSGRDARRVCWEDEQLGTREGWV